MAKVSLFFLIVCSFLALQLTAQTEKQLRSELARTKDKTSQLQIRLRLIDAIYESNRNEWQKEIKLLVLQRRAYVGPYDQALISLLEAERANFLGNRKSLVQIFDNQLQSARFRDPKLNWRKNLLGCAVHPNDPTYHYTRLLAQMNRGLKNREQTALYLQIAKNFTAVYHKDSAIWASNRALQLAKRSDKRWVLIEAMQQQAEVYWQFNLFEQAVQRSIFSLQLAEEAALDYYKLSPLLLIASISSDVKNYNVADAYLKRAQDLAQTMKDERGLAFAHYLFGRYYLGINAPAKAAQRANLAYHWFQETGNVRYTNRSNLLQLVALREAGGRIGSGFSSFVASIAQEPDPLLLSETYYEYGQYLLAAQQFAQAKVAFEKSLSCLPFESLIRPKIANTYRALATIASKTGQLALAYQHQQKYSSWLENSPVWRSAARIEEMAAANLREERERLILNQQASIERAQKEREIVELQRDRQLVISILFILAIIFGVIIYVLRMQQVKIKQEQREAELSQTLLRTQMNPHFVFNAMSVIQSYIYENDPAKSSQFLVNFSRLMRLILENSPKEFIPIELEREILDKYLTAQKMRFENRFDYELTISDDLLFNKAMVSPMITQPFIENAIEHGQLHSVKDGKISVDIYAKDAQLYIEIQDNGVGRKKSADTKKMNAHKSMAIDITRERIAILNKKYKFNGSLTMSDLDAVSQTGTVVTLVLPLKYEPEQ
ncbi:MAG: histidine kinase [Crocinitomicaceae bacterium]|nr:histidine kinase [Crocinitomicaceae bacterium]